MLPAEVILDPDLVLATAPLPTPDVVSEDADEAVDQMPMQRYNGRRITARLEATQ